MNKKHDIIGKKFYDLTVICKDGDGYLCSCVCGGEKRKNSLRHSER